MQCFIILPYFTVNFKHCNGRSYFMAKGCDSSFVKTPHYKGKYEKNPGRKIDMRFKSNPD